MKQPVLLYTLSEKIKKFDPDLSADIIDVLKNIKKHVLYVLVTT